MQILTGTIFSVPDKDTYKCIISINGAGKLNGIPLRFDNEPTQGDEVVCFLFDDPFHNDCVYIPLKTLGIHSFTGISRQGFKLEFNDKGIDVITKGGIGVHIGEKDVKVIGCNSITIPGNVMVEEDGGPFCGLKTCLYMGVPHSGSIITNN